MAFLTKGQVLGVVLQVDPDTPATVAYATDLVAVEGLQAAPAAETTTTDEFTSSLDESPDVPAGGTRPIKATVPVRGVGATAAATGTAPSYGRLLEACAMGVKALTAALTGSVTAATANTVTLPSVANLWPGMPITVAGQTRVIRSLAGNVVTVYPAFSPAPAANAAFTVRAGVVYYPISRGAKVATLGRWRRAESGPAMYDIADGVAGSFTIEAPSRGIVRINFDMVGKLNPPSEVADPGEPVFQAGDALPYLDAVCHFGGASFNPVKWDIANGGKVEQGDDPRQTMGYGAARVSGRKFELKLMPPLALKSVRDEFAIWDGRTPRDFWTLWGNGAGSDVSVLMVDLVSKNPGEEQDTKGVLHEGLTLQSKVRDGALYFWVG